MQQQVVWFDSPKHHLLLHQCLLQSTPDLYSYIPRQSTKVKPMISKTKLPRLYFLVKFSISISIPKRYFFYVSNYLMSPSVTDIAVHTESQLIWSPIIRGGSILSSSLHSQFICCLFGLYS